MKRKKIRLLISSIIISMALSGCSKEEEAILRALIDSGKRTTEETPKKVAEELADEMAGAISDEASEGGSKKAVDNRAANEGESESGQEQLKGKIGNLQGNLNNGGLVAGDGKSTFLSLESGVWRFDDTGKDGEKIHTRPLTDMNMIDGCLYGVQSDEGGNYDVVKVDLLSGKADVILSENKTTDLPEYTDDIHFKDLCVTDQYIYYLSFNNNKWYSSIGDMAGEQRLHNTSLYRANLDGTSVEELIADTGESSEMIVFDDKIYFLRAYRGEGGYYGTAFFQCNMDGNIEHEFFPEDKYSSAYTPETFTIYKDGDNLLHRHIYSLHGEMLADESSFYLSISYGTGEESTYLYQYDNQNMDGMITGKEGLLQANGTELILYEDEFYFCGASQEEMGGKYENYGLYKARTGDMDEVIPIFTFSSNYEAEPYERWRIGLNEEYLYFYGATSWESDGVPEEMYRIKTDGSDLGVIREGKIEAITKAEMTEKSKRRREQMLLDRKIVSKEKNSSVIETNAAPAVDIPSSDIISEQEAVNLLIDNVREPDGYWGLPYSCRGVITDHGEKCYLIDTPWGEPWLVTLDGKRCYVYAEGGR